MSPVAAGQLVQVYKPTPCCGNVMQLGKKFRVAVLLNGNARCKYCGESITGLAAVDADKKVGFVADVLRPVVN